MAIFDVIKKKKDNNSIVWKYPKTNFNTGANLIVNESEEALFFSCGKALDLFGPGKHRLSTNNIPLLRSIINIPTGGKTPFTCEVYFIDKTIQKFKWGTNSKIEFMEPKYNFPIKIGASGEIRFKIDDSRKFITKLVGIKKDFTEENVEEFFTSNIMMKVKTYISKTITDEKICIFEIDQKLEKFSKEIEEYLTDDLEEFGIELEKFIITTIAKPEDDRKYLEFKELFFKQSVGLAEKELEQKLSIIEEETKAKQKIISSQAEATKRQQEGYTYQEEQGYAIGKEVAKNDAVGQYTNVGVGLGMISGIGSQVGDKVSKQVTTAFTSTTSSKVCPNCHCENNSDTNFCMKCGTKLDKLICPKCYKELPKDALFCPYCGERLGK